MKLKNIYNRGLIANKNTHQFSRELHGREYVFAPNGTFRNTDHLTALLFKPFRTADSEILFFNLLNWMKENEITALNTDTLDDFQEHLNAINGLQSAETLTSEFSCLIYYADIFKSGLFFLNGHQEYSCCGKILSDSDCEISFEEEKESRQNVHIFATQKMADEPEWQRFETGELRISSNGKLVFANSLDMAIRIANVKFTKKKDILRGDVLIIP